MKVSQYNIKPLFCIDITSDKKNNELNGSEFIIRTASKQKIDKYDNKRANLEQTVEKSKLPLWLEIIKNIFGFFALIVLFACIRAGFETAWKNAAGMIIIGIFCGMLWIILQVLSKCKEKKVLKKENVESRLEEINGDFLSIQDELNVPADAVEIDILIFKYKLKNGEIRPCATGMQMTAYFNARVKMYTTPNDLHIADLETVYSFPKSEIKSIITVNKRISVPTWNKEENPTKGKFKSYKLTVSKFGLIFFKPYYILEFEKGGEYFGVYFPCYELDAVESLTGLTASVRDSDYCEKNYVK